jgi:COP9 signalosome complex subunit 3
MANVYSAIPLPHVAQELSMEVGETEAYILSLIQSGFLNATIYSPLPNDATKVLRFFFDPTTGPLAKSEQQQHDELVVQTQRTIMLTDQVRVADHRLHLTRDYLDDVHKHMSRKQSMNPGEEPMDTGWDAGYQEQDEDIMGT